LTLRLLLQPTIAAIAAIKHGVEDARTDRPAYLWALVSNPTHRRDLLRDGWKDVTTVFVATFVIDIVYQVIALAGSTRARRFSLPSRSQSSRTS
jgi:hypothetical protein